MSPKKARANHLQEVSGGGRILTQVTDERWTSGIGQNATYEVV